MNGDEVSRQPSQVLHTLMWLMTPVLAPPTTPQQTHPHFREGTSVNMDQLGGELLGHG